MKNHRKAKFYFRVIYLPDKSSAPLESLSVTLIIRIVVLHLEEMDLKFLIFEMRKLRNKDITKLPKVHKVTSSLAGTGTQIMSHNVQWL